MSKTAVIGTGVDFAKSGDGFIVAFLTDANDPAQLNIPAGNWNYEIYASMSSNGGTPQMYAELYVYDGTTFTLISTSSNEIIYDGTALNLYTFAMAVPATTLALTDRLAIKLYATNSGGKTTTIHTQDSHLCQVITTFSTGITALNGLTAQVQYFQVGTSGTDFNISSTTATHTFNIPDASASARGLITTGTQTIAGTKTFSDATKNNGGIFLQNASSNSLAGYMNLGGLTNGVKFTSGGGVSNTFTLPSATGYTFTFPNATGTLALTSDISYPVTSVFGRTGAVVATSGDYTTAQVTEVTNLYFTDARARLALSFAAGSGAYNNTTGVITIPTNNNQITNGAGYITGNQTITLSGDVSGSGTTAITTTIGALKVTNAMLAGSIDLTTKVTGLLPDGNISSAATWNAKQNAITLTTTGTSGAATLVGATLNIPQYTDAYTGTVTSVAALTIGTTGTDLSSSVANSTTTPVITLNVPTASATNRGALSSADWTTFNNKYNLPSLTSGSVLFSNGSTIAQDNANFFWDDTNNRLGIGTASPAALLHVSQSGANTQLRIGNNSAYDQFIYFNGNNDWSIGMDYSNSNAFVISNNSSLGTNDRFVLTTSGNLGLGVTPSAWYTGYTALQVGESAALFSNRTSADTRTTQLANNAYLNSGATNWIYAQTDEATRYGQVNGEHQWFNAPSGTAGAAITFTQAMTLTAAGRLLINTPTESTYQLDVNGTGRFITSLTIGAGASQANIYLNRSATTSVENAIRWQTNGTSDWYLGSAASGANSDLELYNYGIGAVNLKLSRSTGAATFSSSVTTNANEGFIIAPSSGASYINYKIGATSYSLIGIAGSASDLINGSALGDLNIRATNSQKILFSTNNGGSAALTIASTGAATFSSDLRADGTDFRFGGNYNPTVEAGRTSFNINGTSNALLSFTVAGTLKGYVYHNSTNLNLWNSVNGAVIIATDNTARLTINGSGNVGIGTTNPLYKLVVSNGGAEGLEIGTGYVSNKTLIQAYNRSGATYNQLDFAATAFSFNNSVTATSFFESSDSRLKTLIQDNYQTKGIASITPKLYTKNGKVELGYYAQDLVGVLDSAVSKGDDNMLNLSYREVHTAKIYALEQEIKELKSKLN
jgi:hypothetical protein